MTATAAQWTVLLAHRNNAREPVSGIAVEVSQPAPGTLRCGYSLHGDIGRVKISGAGAGKRADGLWQHTCFEAFIATAAAPGYYEFNFSPALAWAAYRFSGYRAGMTAATLAREPDLNVRRDSHQLELSATLHLAGLTELIAVPVLRLALAAVVEDSGGAMSYWALEHAPGKPDFHHPDGFTLEMSIA